jgi:hypothetical protein
MTLKDQTGNTNVIVCRDLANGERRVLHLRRLIVHRQLEHQGTVTRAVAAHVENASDLIAGLDPLSRDFH